MGEGCSIEGFTRVLEASGKMIPRTCVCNCCKTCIATLKMRLHRQRKAQGLVRVGVRGIPPSCLCGSCKICRNRQAQARYQERKRKGLHHPRQEKPLVLVEGDTFEDISLERVEGYWQKEEDKHYYDRISSGVGVIASWN